ncbi:hypothetical protein FIBSPDRAFT_950925 [Athelia psychrophila]|uniref:Uncharacterized protein n=1 Tax=Athelia psychrophila TaxID=1759441 RepID=A0A166NDM7_9AGAM|nr:hypothetical protein FIBSPDRAFT_950925 [Fibularhizoctonia sp. CBS 109695]
MFEAQPGTALDEQQKALEAAAMLLRTVSALSEEEAEDVLEEGVNNDKGPTEEEEPQAGEEDRESPQGGDQDEDESKDIEQEDSGEERNGVDDGDDDELPRGGWDAPGRLRGQKTRRAGGLLDVITLGCVLEFTTALGSDRYGNDYDPSSDSVASDLEQENLARTWFRVIMKTFTSRFFTVIEGTIVHTLYIWESILVGFAAAVVRHMKSKQKVVEQVHKRGLKEVAAALSLHLELDHLHLVNRTSTWHGSTGLVSLVRPCQRGTEHHT